MDNFKEYYTESEYFVAVLSTSLLELISYDDEVAQEYRKAMAAIQNAVKNPGERPFELTDQLTSFFARVFMIAPQIIEPYNRMIAKADHAAQKITRDLT
ncbi:MAG: hypothetical protein GY818_07000 [Planctomycetaceae bacterium]|nr:hypothetical protein [Planctomycetaceae bacterium]